MRWVYRRPFFRSFLKRTRWRAPVPTIIDLGRVEFESQLFAPVCMSTTIVNAVLMGTEIVKAVRMNSKIIPAVNMDTEIFNPVSMAVEIL